MSESVGLQQTNFILRKALMREKKFKIHLILMKMKGHEPNELLRKTM